MWIKGIIQNAKNKGGDHSVSLRRRICSFVVCMQQSQVFLEPVPIIVNEMVSIIVKEMGIVWGSLKKKRAKRNRKIEFAFLIFAILISKIKLF